VQKKIFFHFIVDYRFLKMRQKNIDKIRKIYVSSMVERQHPVRGRACSSPGKSIIFKLGLSLQKMRQIIGKNPPKQ
jgi:hypothetical protein